MSWIKRKIRAFINIYKTSGIIFKATIWFMVCSILQKGMSVLTTPIFTRLLTTEQYGLYTSYNSWMNIFTIITTLNLGQGVYNKAMSKFKNNRDEYTSAMQGLTATITTVVFIVYLILKNQINTFVEMPTFLMVAMFIELYFAPAFTFWSRRMRYDYKYKAIVFVTLGMTACNVLLGICAVLLFESKGTARILSIIFVQVVFGLILTIFNFKKGKTFFDKTFWKFALTFNLPLLPHYFSMYVLDQSDRIMIQKMCGYSTVAIYGVAYNLSMVTKIVIDSLNNSIIPWLYESLEKKEYKNIRKKVNSISFILVGIVVAFMLIAPEFMTFFATEQYKAAIYIIPPVTSSIVFIFLYNLFGNTEFYFDCNKFTMVVSSIGAILNIVLNYIFINMFGFVAAGFTTLFCYIIFAVSHYLYSKHISNSFVGVTIFDGKNLIAIISVIIFVVIMADILYLFTALRYVMIILFAIICFIKKDAIINQLKEIR